ncbi:MAG: replication-associated recombination protein A [Crocinitomicaceae bacterium]|jgi:putative ATPase|nr:replication-associated recombination protein A [Crocinitomicaceae bacterium]MDP4723618.1 replication-associated recombination protein A [Crocinitomicaceae bacterium]MDP4738888.1 replication-associated recombination protein A [Crocinitomicaceae bacterium]MDP4799004.1 replication-associated recombination protein A [Crocinitomicaceae bacterium]MDP4805775.1 replication-associated recombination protein A [Crocinitomicaceae bacterium]
MNAPLAERMRPQTLDQYIGQQHLLAPNASLRRALDAGVIPSMIFWGPPGVGKTTLAQLIAQHLGRPIHTLSAISSGVKDVREVIAKVQGGGMFSPKGSILFIDEIHRFSKAQQDSLLGAVEKGIITLIGATTENPSFEVISALLSRCQVYTLVNHTKEDLLALLDRAIHNDPILQRKQIALTETNALLRISGGDARKLLNVFEIIIGTFQTQVQIELTDEMVLQNAQQSLASYDKDGEQHYDIISAFIKSVRGSDPNAAVYWLARMVEGGEDPKFIARRLVILAAEDIGLANPNALLLANACFQAIENVGWPESRIILSECTLYLASSPKGNAAYMAINQAQQMVQKTGNLGVPLPLRNAPSALMKELGYGDGYQYSHDHPGNFFQQEFLPEQIAGTNFFQPGSSAKEQEIAQQIKKWWQDKYNF